MVEETKVVEQVAETPPAPPVEDINTIKGEIEKLKTELEQKDKGFKSLQQSLTQKDRELKSQADLRAEIKGIREDMELLAVGLATKDEVEPTDGASRQNVLAELKKRRAASEAKLKADADALAYQERVATLSGYQKRVEALGLTEDDDDYGDIYRLVRTLDPVDLKTAERRLQKLEAKKVVKPETPQESEGELRERIYKEEMEKRHPGMYASDTSFPSGGKPVSATDAMAKYGRGEISAEEAAKYGVKFD